MITNSTTETIVAKPVAAFPATISDYEQLGKQISKTPGWKRSFYHAYKSKDYSLAGYIYFSKHYYRTNLMTVHEAYKYEKKLDVQIFLFVVAFMMLVTAIFYLLFS